MSGAQTSPFLTTNELLAPMQAYDTHQNQLLAQQQHQQAIGAQELGMMGQIAGAMLGLKPEERADAYPRLIGLAQAQGFGKNAPATYPGDAAARSLLQMSLSLKDQYGLGMITSPAMADALKIYNAPLPGPLGAAAAPGAGTGTAAAPGTIEQAALDRARAVYDGAIKRGADHDAAIGWAANALHESAANPNTGPGDRGASHGLYQLTGPRYEAYIAKYGHPPDNAPLDEQLDFVVHELSGSESLARGRIAAAQGPEGKAAEISQAFLRPKDTAAEMQRRAATAKQLAGLWTPQAAAGQGDEAWLTEMAKRYPSLAGPNTNVNQPATADQTAAGDARVQVAAATPATATDATTAPVAPSGGAPVQTAQAAPPSVTPGTGVNSPQFQAALELNNRATALESMPGAAVDPRIKAMVANLRAKAALYMQADSVSVDQNTGIQTKQLTGERLNAAAPNARYEWDPERGAYVDRTGTHPPVTPPSPRTIIAPGGDVLQSEPGGGVRVVKPADPQSIVTQEAAKTQGAGVGKDVAGQVPKLAEQGRNAGQAIANIDYGMNQVREATRGGIPTGYFSQALATAAAAAKSLGIDTSALGVDPAAVGNIQSAQKTLGVVAGAILQQAIGKGGQITDAKIEHFIHTQPGIETDPHAIERVLNWARSQFVYEQEMSKAAMEEASKSPTGTLPLNWQARYLHERGFAPIYNPATGEMQQPDGGAPSREPPATRQPEFTEGQTAIRSDGHRIIYRNGKWGPM